MPPGNNTSTRLPQRQSQTVAAVGARAVKQVATEREAVRKSLLPQRTPSVNRKPTTSVRPTKRFDATSSEHPEQSYDHGTEGGSAERASQSTMEEQRQKSFDALTGADHNDTSLTITSPEGNLRLSHVGCVQDSRFETVAPRGAILRSDSIRKLTTPHATAVKAEQARQLPPPSVAMKTVSRSHVRQASSTSATSGRPPSKSKATEHVSERQRSTSSSASHQVSATSQAARPGSQEDWTNTGVSRGHTRAASALPAFQARPQFTTYQQHFSPKKTSAPKAMTSSFLTAASVPTKAKSGPQDPPTAEVVRQQIELLQLHLVHVQAIRCLRSFEVSAEDEFRQRFSQVSSHCKAVQEEERHVRTATNMAGLRDWIVGAGSMHENLQTLSGVLKEVSVLQSEAFDLVPGHSQSQTGRFNEVIQEFVGWLGDVQDVWAARDNDRQTSANIIANLSPQWHAAVSALQRKIGLLLRDLDAMDLPKPGSSVADVARAAKLGLQSMAHELSTIKALVAVVIAKETSWVDDQVQALSFAGIEYHDVP